jgi:hypothetical protein
MYAYDFEMFHFYTNAIDKFGAEPVPERESGGTTKAGGG